MAEKSLRVEQYGGVYIASFKDNSILDIASIQKIGQELYELAETEPQRQIVLNFAAVRFLSSQALGVLLTLRRKAEAAKATVVLAELRPELARVFKITNLDKMFKFFDTRDAALKHFGVEPPTELTSKATR